MTKKELSSIYYIRQEIKMWEEQLELLTCKAQGKAMRLTGMPFAPSSGTGDQMADIAVRKADITELIEKKKERLQQALIDKRIGIAIYGNRRPGTPLIAEYQSLTGVKGGLALQNGIVPIELPETEA